MSQKDAPLYKAQVDAKAKELESKAKSLVSIKEALEKKQEEIENFHRKTARRVRKDILNVKRRG